MLNQTRVGLYENRLNFMLLVVTNFFVGSMVGLERTLLPVIAEEDFGLVSTSAALSFIVSFGFSKAVVNYFAGAIADRFDRKNVLLFGWFVGLFVPMLVIFATSWWMIIVANVLLGINQGLTWSMTVNMKIDLAKPTERGLAVGMNEFAGYVGVAVMAAVSGYVATTFSSRPEPFYIGVAIALIGFLLSMFVKDTSVQLGLQGKGQGTRRSRSAKEVFIQTTWKDRSLSSLTAAGLSTNLKDGMAWGLFPFYFASKGLSLSEIGLIVAVYPAAWGFFQLFTGVLSDRIGRKGLIVGGMLVQATSLWLLLLVSDYGLWLLAALLLGIGTAMVYPTIQASISDVAEPNWRASAMGVYRFWRDSGYAFGALFAGVLTDVLSIDWAIGLVAVIPFLAGLVAFFRLRETLPGLRTED
ncbi:MFS transporter [Exiguobacterium sp. ZOR0005]|uniref:MFS transporter n=1 Tax=Exiguobacterium sp. ZOR0005 TaxID=1339226 RepID=UPI000A64BCD9|nr:MFS transporter [Exiguobacterium sp. ZOR0005]